MPSAQTYNCLIQDSIVTGHRFRALDDTPRVYGDEVEFGGRKVTLNGHFYCNFAPSLGDDLELSYVQPAFMGLGRSILRFADAAVLAQSTEFSFGTTVYLDWNYPKGHTKPVCINFEKPCEPGSNILVIDGVVYGIAGVQEGMRGRHYYLDRPLDRDVTLDSIATLFTSPKPRKAVTIVTANLAGQAELTGDTWIRFGSRITQGENDRQVRNVIIDLLAGFLVDN